MSNFHTNGMGRENMTRSVRMFPAALTYQLFEWSAWFSNFLTLYTVQTVSEEVLVWEEQCTYSGRVGIQVDGMSCLQKPDTGEQLKTDTIISDKLHAEINMVTTSISVFDLTDTSDLYCKSRASLMDPRLQ